MEYLAHPTRYMGGYTGSQKQPSKKQSFSTHQGFVIDVELVQEWNPVTFVVQSRSSQERVD